MIKAELKLGLIACLPVSIIGRSYKNAKSANNVEMKSDQINVLIADFTKGKTTTSPPKAIQKVNIKIDLPTVDEAIRIAKRQINTARSRGTGILKLVHGYGSSGKGGKIRIELREELMKMKSRRMVSDVIFGEDFSRNKCKQLLRRFPELKDEEDLNRGNKGVTLVEL